MDLLNGKIQTLYRKYLNAAFGSVLILKVLSRVGHVDKIAKSLVSMIK